MPDPWIIVALTIVGVVVVRYLIVLVLAGGDFARVSLAMRIGMRVLRDRDFGARVQALDAPKAPPKPSGEPLRLIALLQREGRLVDFLVEDIAGLPDDQIGAAVYGEVHRKCRHALQEHVVLEPVLPQTEGERVEVPAGFNPSAIQLTGNVAGQPPFRGTLQHPGWRVKELKLATPAREVDEFVLQPAEVEIS